jgi:hypothetical protein
MIKTMFNCFISNLSKVTDDAFSFTGVSQSDELEFSNKKTQAKFKAVTVGVTGVFHEFCTNIKTYTNTFVTRINEWAITKHTKFEKKP